MSSAMTVAEPTGGERPGLIPADLSQYQQRGRYLRALEWRRSLKHVAGGLRRVLYVGANYVWRGLHTAYSAIARERERSAYRCALQELNTWTLKDIGLHRGEIPWALNGLSTTGKLSRLSAWSVRD